MPDGLLNIAKLIRPRQLLKALLHPAEELRAFKFRCRRVPEAEFAGFLARLAGQDQRRVEAVRADLDGNLDGKYSILAEKARDGSDRHGD